VPDAIRSEILVAVVVLRARFTPSIRLMMQPQDWVKKHFAAHAHPQPVHYVFTLPKTPSGKFSAVSCVNTFATGS
jgi:acetyl-CoA synthetase